MTASEGRFVTTQDGLRLFVRTWGAQGPETGAPILCLHGLTRNSRDFEGVAPRMAGLGRRVYALDVRGRGLSDRDPQPERYAPPVYAGDVLAAMAQLELPQAVFVGTSMGGIITMILAAMAPDRIVRVVLNDVGPVLSPEGLARIAGYVGKVDPVPDWEAAADAVWRINASAFPNQPPSFFMAFARRTFRQDAATGVIAPDYDPAIAAPFRQPNGAAPVDMWPLFDALKAVPTLLVRGGLSDLLTPETVSAMRARHPDLGVVQAAQVGHAPQLDEPDVWPTLEAFLTRP